ncbi:peptidyl-prolyl cis-trans isomerase [Saccharopolyspora endophytica]|uniref:peptidylprolyl isomerase n=2 Tax=Saccharopolyspora endophytica TaxID=543886 RepID=A0ABS5DBA7_9PSEU|nr:peptidyl-prolyl cis-trans isomerase [Saccharopolyspora endophytica]
MKVRVPKIPTRGALDRLAGYIGRPSAFGLKGYRAGVVIAMLVVVVGGSSTKAVMHAAESLPEDAAFRAQGVVVTEQQLKQRVSLMEFVYGLQQPKELAKQDEFKRSVAKAMAVSNVVDQAAREQGIVIADKAASDQLEKMIKETGYADRKTFIQELGARGISEQNVIDEIKRQQGNARLFGKVTEPVKPVTDADAQRYFDQNRAQMVTPEQRDIANIVVPDEATAQQVLQQANAGGDFAALARQFSIDGSTKDKGGSLGLVQVTQLDPGYGKAAFGAPAGSAFGPVQTPQGWNVGRVGEVRPSEPVSFEQVRDAIKGKLDNDAKLAAWDGFLAQRIKDADVTYAPEYQPANPDASPVQAGQGN